MTETPVPDSQLFALMTVAAQTAAALHDQANDMLRSGDLDGALAAMVQRRPWRATVEDLQSLIEALP